MFRHLSRLDAWWTGTRVYQWWSLENWTHAGNFALRILGVVAAIGALNFFTVRPRVSVEATCRSFDDVSSVIAAYRMQRAGTSPLILTLAVQKMDADKGVPLSVAVGSRASSASRLQCTRAEIVAVNQPVLTSLLTSQALAVGRIFALRGGDKLRILAYLPGEQVTFEVLRRDGRTVARGRVFRNGRVYVKTKAGQERIINRGTLILGGPLSSLFTTVKRTAIGKITPTKLRALAVVYGSLRMTNFTVPDYAAALAANSSLDPSRLGAALSALELSRKIVVTARVTNSGKGSASHVTVDPPFGFRLADQTAAPFSLAPGESNDVTFEASASTVLGLYRSSDFHAHADQALVVNVQTLVFITLALFGVLWLPAVFFDVRRTGASGT